MTNYLDRHRADCGACGDGDSLCMAGYLLAAREAGR